MTTIQSILDNYNDNVIALALHLETIVPDILIDTSESTSNLIIEALDEAKELIDDSDYLSLTDSEADDIEDERLDDYIDECILPELPDHLQAYFDDKAWKRDARYDWRGHIIASYDGEEHEQEYNGTTYYIYRIN